MFTILLDDKILWRPDDPDKKILNPTVNLSVNSVGSASFKILPTHKYYNDIVKMSSIITVIQNGRIIFKGRVYTDKKDFRNVRTIEAEGILGRLNDTIVRPYEYSGSVEGYLTYLINQHNDQGFSNHRFELGRVTVTDSNDYITRSSTELPNTWKEIENKLINKLGGYIDIRYEEDGNYIDYLADYEDTATQDIKYSLNLLDLNTECKADTLATCIIPYGAEDEETGERVNIKSVNYGHDYIENAEACALYGHIYEVVTWDDVTLPNNLLSKARLYLANRVKLTNKLTIKAIDLNLSDSQIEGFKKGDYVRVYSEPHGINETALVTDYKIDLSDPTKSTITLGIENESYLERSKKETDNRIEIAKQETGELITQKAGKVFNETQTYVNEVIDNSEENTRKLLQEYALSTDLEDLSNTVSTQFTQTANDFTMKFDNLTERITEENGETVRRVENLEKYIRYENGAIIIGERGSDLTTKIANGRISFLYNDSLEVAYISDNKLYITEAEILDKLILGSFAFIPRSNGNLSFKKI